MSSGYSSLEEDSEEYFFTARTSFFRKPSGKVTESKVTSHFHPARAPVCGVCVGPSCCHQESDTVSFITSFIIVQDSGAEGSLILLRKMTQVKQEVI